jgi:mannose-6-phosphate isomerase-like protein (cupin superfamily)
MHQFDRRALLTLITTLPFISAKANGQSSTPISVVASCQDRTGRPHKAARANSHLDFKVITQETAGRVFLMENRDMVRGGPPRHVHYEQEEWFYFLEGSEVIMEIGEQKLRLKPGDSILAPRDVPHVWAYLGPQPGRMLFAFTPAARIESFFEETSKPDAKIADPQRFERHGMKVLGPPLLG